MQVKELEIVTCASVAELHKGPVVLIFHQYANYGKTKNIPLSGQLKYYRNKVDENQGR